MSQHSTNTNATTVSIRCRAPCSQEGSLQNKLRPGLRVPSLLVNGHSWSMETNVHLPSCEVPQVDAQHDDVRLPTKRLWECRESLRQAPWHFMGCLHCCCRCARGYGTSRPAFIAAANITAANAACAGNTASVGCQLERARKVHLTRCIRSAGAPERFRLYGPTGETPQNTCTIDMDADERICMSL